MDFQETGLWQKTLGSEGREHGEARERLRASYRRFRQGVAVLAAEIHRDMPDFTVHDITHIDALWGVADTIAGPDVELTPIEAYVLGGAFLLHDLGMGLAAWPDRRKDLEQHPRWADTVASLLQRRNHAAPKPEEIAAAPGDIREQAIRELLRLLHAEHAEALPECLWQDDVTKKPHMLIEDEALRFHLGPVIGRIAHSHWWDVDRLQREFSTTKGAPTGFPLGWKLDPLRVAALLRVTDAAHLDDRRAPRLLRAARGITGVARSHWVFQGHLNQVRREEGRLVFSATRPFTADESEAWWLAYETLQMVDRELHTVDALLADTHRPRFPARGVAGVENPSRLQSHIPVHNWEPVVARVRVGDVAGLVERLGGRELYGDDPTVPLRELIQNASDAVRARRVVEGRDSKWGSITVRLGKDDRGPWLEIEDDGVGMSRSVLTGPLLDFGESYWGSTLCRDEHPGLVSGGFEPTGRYGIGFFSVFMWGDHVRVTSRRYDEGKVDTHTLEFHTGLHTRPILRKANREEWLRDGGTRVRVWLKDEPTEARGLLRAESDQVWPLAKLCAWLAPALPVDLWVEASSAPQRVVEADDWRSMPPVLLLERLWDHDEDVDSDELAKWLSEEARRLRHITDSDGRTLARASVVPGGVVPRSSREYHLPPSAVTIGGLRAGSTNCLCGILVGRPSRADRMAGIPLAVGSVLEDWATEQGELLQSTAYSSERLNYTANVIQMLGGSTRGLPVIQCSTGWVRTEQVPQAVCDLDEVVFVDRSLISLRERDGVQALLVPGVFVVGLFSIEILRSSYRDSWPSRSHSLDAGGFYRDTLIRVAVAASARAWGVAEEMLWDTAEYTTAVRRVVRVVGTQEGKPFAEPVIVLHRPR